MYAGAFKFTPRGATMNQLTPKANKLWYLKHINLFSCFSETELQEIDRITRMQEVGQRQRIFLPGDPSNTVYLLKKGQVKIAGTIADGREVIFEILTPGEIFGEAEMLNHAPHDTYAEALGDVLICAISREDFERYLRKHQDLTFRLTKLVGNRLRKIRRRVVDLIFRNVPARLAHLLVELGQTDGIPDHGGIRLRVKLTHQEIASLIGCSRETVSTALGQMRDQGLLRSEGRSITIVNMDRLSHMAS